MINLNSSTALSDRINWLLDKAIAEKTEEKRNYLGCSILGHECERAVQYEALKTVFRIDIPDDFPPRVRRIFARGVDAEARAADWFASAGFVLLTEDPATHTQFKVSFCENNIQGHLDGIFALWRGAEASPFPLPALWENKCVNAKGWRQVVKEKVRHAYPKYFAQMQLYMGGMGLDKGLITFVNADTLELHHELVGFEEHTFQGLITRGRRVLEACKHGEWVPTGAGSEASLSCRMCSYSQTCWA